MASERPLPQSEEEWRGILTPQQYRVLREKGTDRPFGPDYDEFKHQADGEYRCAACGNLLFTSTAKFDSGCGWPSFYEALNKEAVVEHEDSTLGMRRVEVTCARCASHLGHVFPDGYGTPTGMRYCINATAIQYSPATSER
ncbi:MAG: peptide-methionine (R)-S-oxide reductase [Armatimonadota bacterium]